jgi:hypothetical protein
MEGARTCEVGAILAPHNRGGEIVYGNRSLKTEQDLLIFPF